MNGNGNGNNWLRTLLVSVAAIVLGAAIIGSATNTFSNSVGQATLETEVAHIEKDVEEIDARTQGIDVMQKQVDIIEQNVGKILEKLDK